MKEASGEASMTGLTIALIAIVAVAATPLITNLVKNITKKSCCTGAGYRWSNQQCLYSDGAEVTTSKYYDDANNKCVVF